MLAPMRPRPTIPNCIVALLSCPEADPIRAGSCGDRVRADARAQPRRRPGPVRGDRRPRPQADLARPARDGQARRPHGAGRRRCLLAVGPRQGARLRADGGRVVVEKPFGHDLQSARALNAALHAVFPEERIFRIDHYLGKEPVENLFYFRFANTFLEPVWNRNNVAAIQITMAEDFGVSDRGRFYDETGAIRDVIQNHMLQILAVLTMEP